MQRGLIHGTSFMPWYSKRNYILNPTVQMGRYQSGQKWLVHTSLFINKQEKGHIFNVHAFTNNTFPIILKTEQCNQPEKCVPILLHRTDVASQCHQSERYILLDKLLVTDGVRYLCRSEKHGIPLRKKKSIDKYHI